MKWALHANYLSHRTSLVLLINKARESYLNTSTCFLREANFKRFVMCIVSVLGIY